VVRLLGKRGRGHDKLRLNRTGLDGSYFIGIQCNGSYSSLPSAAQLQAAAGTFPAGMPKDIYAADELNNCTGAYASLKQLARNAHAAGVKTGMTLNTPESGLYDDGGGTGQSAIDRWILLTSMQGWPTLPWTGPGELWSYPTCNVGFGNTPEWMVDYPLINERIIGRISRLHAGRHRHALLPLGRMVIGKCDRFLE